MRIAILSQYYPPEVGASQNRLSVLARLLVARGHSVEVLTALPNYPRRKCFRAYQSRFPVHETLDGIPVHRLGLHLPSRRTSPRRMLHYGSFALNALLRGGRFLAPADYLITESPPLHLVPTGALLARRLGAKLVLNVSDLWPASALQTGVIRPGRVTRMAVRFEEWCYRRAALITAQSEGIVDDIANRFPKKVVSLYPHGVDLKQWSNMPTRAAARRTLGWQDQSVIVGYTGLHGPTQALHQIVLAAQRLRDDPRIQIVLFGDGPQKRWLEARAKQLDVVNVRFHPEEPHYRMPTILAGLDIGLATLASGKIFEGVRTSKMLEIGWRPVCRSYWRHGENPRACSTKHKLGSPYLRMNRKTSPSRFADSRATRIGAPVWDRTAGVYVEQQFDNERIVSTMEDLLHAHLVD